RSHVRLPRPFFEVMLSTPEMPDRVTIDKIDAELVPGARNAIRICLNLQAEVEEVGSEHAVFVLENYDSRPLTNMPPIILEDLERSQVSIFCAQSQRGELGSRMEMSAIVNRKRIRHGHMVNITRQIMLEGMRADFR